ncbi:DUF4174 domain-containing protein [Primorskyibacter marinus]|uniref:DUF4174 domain-containing protein n=1 Tax=Primorskyibacter marinus TaxID=1977320 RepID=UPI000E309605|nr:DUF4174 domain-containing protein [Primorskyibacter marinus]
MTLSRQLFSAIFATALAISPAITAAAEEVAHELLLNPPETEELPLVRSAEGVDLAEYLWIKRPIIVFADSPADPRYVQQMQFINDRIDDLALRDVVVLTDTDASSASPARQKLRPRGFMLAILGKDGDVKLRKPLPWSVREITRSIDKFPMRQQEIRDRHPARP